MLGYKNYAYFRKMYICLLVKMSKNPTMSSSYLFLILDTFLNLKISALVAFFSVRGHQRLPPLTLLFDFCSALPSFGPLSICVILWGKLRRGLSSSAPGDVDLRSGVLLWSGRGEAEASDGDGWALSSWYGRVVIRRVTLRCGVE
ncbi:BnaC03g44880D [Brassica napus]|uniref:(rape) hypothetical protein n=1 Tax=Brassica napus TaxID=3708 RepID=A0A078IM08_BRANA|nr:unnamed protein product [Brassica napus]CDY50048.1 BnaC03g44880D [Brassica napus]